MFICAVSHSGPSHILNGNTGIWRVASSSKQREPLRGAIRAKNTSSMLPSADNEWYQEWFENYLIPAAKMNIHWFKGNEVIFRQNGATPHMGNDTPQKLHKAGTMGRCNISVATQPAQSLKLNIDDLGFFASLTSRV